MSKRLRRQCVKKNREENTNTKAQTEGQTDKQAARGKDTDRKTETERQTERTAETEKHTKTSEIMYKCREERTLMDRQKTEIDIQRHKGRETYEKNPAS